MGKEQNPVRDCSLVPGYFENLAAAGFDVIVDCTSDRTPTYNCIAWAAGKTNEWWWPWDVGGYSWPGGLPKELPGQETIQNFINAFVAEGYVPCQDDSVEAGFEKVAIFADQRNRPTHAARSLPAGAWTSKLGDQEDIRHPSLESIGGRIYGQAVAFLKRQLPPQPAG